MIYTESVFYPISKEDGFFILQKLWPLSDGSDPDLTRGRRYLGSSLYGDKWEFWLKSGKKVSFTISSDGFFVGSIEKEPDPELPEERF